MTSLRPRRFRAAVLSVVVVALPTFGSAVTLELALRTGRGAMARSDPAGLLLALAELALAGVLAWAGAAVAAGVADAWATSAGTPCTGSPPRGTPAAGTATAVGTASWSGPPPRGRTGAVSAGVAALVVAALTAPGAAAASGPPGGPDVVCAQAADTADAPVTAAPEGVEQPVPSPDAAAVAPQPGSWSALVDDGFRAPRGAPTGSTALVTAQPSRQAAPGGAAPEVVVLAGDSLWSIAERHLGPGADAAEVAEAWPRWWQENRSVVGDDPDLLLPGQRLVVPSP